MFVFQKKIIIYGAGNVGKKFYKKVKGKWEVICFVDKETAGEEFDNIPIRRLEEADYNGGVSFIVTSTYDFENIYGDIKGCYDKAEIVSLDSILAND